MWNNSLSLFSEIIDLKNQMVITLGEKNVLHPNIITNLFVSSSFILLPKYLESLILTSAKFHWLYEGPSNTGYEN